MIQYEISRDTFGLIRWIYNKFLKDDKDWHFFHEGSYMLIRLKKRNKSIEKSLKEGNIKFSVRLWEDAHWLVRKYQSIFKDIFHCYSVLSMEVKKKEFRECLDRVVHCYCNMSAETLKRLKLAEEDAVALYAVGRGRYNGYMYRASEEKGCLKK